MRTDAAELTSLHSSLHAPLTTLHASLHAARPLGASMAGGGQITHPWTVRPVRLDGISGVGLQERQLLQALLVNSEGTPSGSPLIQQADAHRRNWPKQAEGGRCRLGARCCKALVCTCLLVKFDGCAQPLPAIPPWLYT